MLFCLDYAVNQKAAGTRLYRLHDDMWIWGSSEKCATAWTVVTEFTDTMGLELNQDKTGSARITKDSGAAASAVQPGTLPAGHVTWGFLKLDAATGRFLVDQQEVDKHIEELRIQLSACRSVLDYIQAWNIYGNRFFSNNFGRPANCYGRAHLNSMLATFRRIQEKLFPDHSGGVGEHLKLTIASRFGLSASEIPDGYLYWPSSLGGLALQNPFIMPLLSRRAVAEDPEKLMDEFLKEEKFEYVRARSRFEESTSDAGRDDSSSASGYGTSWRDAAEFKDLQKEPFMSLEEFTRYRERTSTILGQTYKQLMMVPEGSAVAPGGEAKAALTRDNKWQELGDYEKRVVQLYHKEMTSQFGGLNVVDQGLLPTGLITMLRESKFRWQG
jgi:hypothetical protein